MNGTNDYEKAIILWWCMAWMQRCSAQSAQRLLAISVAAKELYSELHTCLSLRRCILFRKKDILNTGSYFYGIGGKQSQVNVLSGHTFLVSKPRGLGEITRSLQCIYHLSSAWIDSVLCGLVVSCQGPWHMQHLQLMFSSLWFYKSTTTIPKIVNHSHCPVVNSKIYLQPQRILSMVVVFRVKLLPPSHMNEPILDAFWWVTVSSINLCPVSVLHFLSATSTPASIATSRCREHLHQATMLSIWNRREMLLVHQQLKESQSDICCHSRPSLATSPPSSSPHGLGAPYV